MWGFSRVISFLIFHGLPTKRCFLAAALIWSSFFFSIAFFYLRYCIQSQTASSPLKTFSLALMVIPIMLHTARFKILDFGSAFGVGCEPIKGGGNQFFNPNENQGCSCDYTKSWGDWKALTMDVVSWSHKGWSLSSLVAVFGKLRRNSQFNRGISQPLTRVAKKLRLFPALVPW